MSSNIPFDICVQIMELLPVKTLLRFRSVCKEWKSFIDCSEFIAAYSFRHTRPHHLMIRYLVGNREEEEVKYVSFVDDDTLTFPQQNFALTVPPLVQITNTNVIGSCHGLFCLTGYFGEPADSSRTQIVVLWNPTIRKSIAVVVPNIDYVIGFGVCPDTKDPKILKITRNGFHIESKDESIPFHVMVFTLSSGEWTTLCSNPLHPESIEFGSPTSINIGQFIYWNALDENDEEEECFSLIISFDLSTDELREIHLPDSLRKADFDISGLRESLVLLEYYVDFTTDKQVCDVWMMEHGDPKAFTKLFTISAPNAHVGATRGFRKSGEPIIEMLDDAGIDKTTALVVYEPCLENIRDLGIRGNRCSFFVTSYMESLLLLDYDDGHIVGCGPVKS